MQLVIWCFLAVATVVNGASIAPNDYHEKIGIPLASRLKKLEKEAFESGQTETGRIAGGIHTDISVVPYQAGIVIEIPSVILSCCGGALLSPTRVLSAAHCYYDTATHTVVLGSNFIFYGGTRVVVTNWINYPDYIGTGDVAHDIAVLHIPPVAFTNLIQPVSLPTTAEEISSNFAGQMGLISGYGITPEVPSLPFDQRLSSVNALIMTPEECGAFYGTIGSRDITICTSGAGGVGACSSDSGGPLTVVSNGRRLLVGIVSFGGACGGTSPSGFARVTSYLSWILAH